MTGLLFAHPEWLTPTAWVVGLALPGLAWASLRGRSHLRAFQGRARARYWPRARRSPP